MANKIMTKYSLLKIKESKMIIENILENTVFYNKENLNLAIKSLIDARSFK